MSNHTPHKNIGRESWRNRNAGSGVFALGNPNVSGEIRENGQRILIWERKESDSYFAEIAGWENLQIDPSNLGYGNVGAIRIPAGTRTVRSVLAGYEAWSGEKAQALAFVADYTRRVQDVFGAGNVDISVTLDSIALTRNGEQFITPPHDLQNDPKKIAEWRELLITETAAALENVTYQGPIELIEEFAAKLEESTMGNA